MLCVPYSFRSCGLVWSCGVGTYMAMAEALPISIEKTAKYTQQCPHWYNTSCKELLYAAYTSDWLIAVSMTLYLPIPVLPIGLPVRGDHECQRGSGTDDRG
jgi:hypothetical protein